MLLSARVSIQFRILSKNYFYIETVTKYGVEDIVYKSVISRTVIKTLLCTLMTILCIKIRALFKSVVVLLKVYTRWEAVSVSTKLNIYEVNSVIEMSESQRV